MKVSLWGLMAVIALTSTASVVAQTIRTMSPPPNVGTVNSSGWRRQDVGPVTLAIPPEWQRIDVNGTSVFVPPGVPLTADGAAYEMYVQVFPRPNERAMNIVESTLPRAYGPAVRPAEYDTSSHVHAVFSDRRRAGQFIRIAADDVPEFGAVVFHTYGRESVVQKYYPSVLAMRQSMIRRRPNTTMKTSKETEPWGELFFGAPGDTYELVLGPREPISNPRTLLDDEARAVVPRSQRRFKVLSPMNGVYAEGIVTGLPWRTPAQGTQGDSGLALAWFDGQHCRLRVVSSQDDTRNGRGENLQLWCSLAGAFAQGTYITMSIRDVPRRWVELF